MLKKKQQRDAYVQVYMWGGVLAPGCICTWMNSTPKKQIKCFHKILKKIVDDHVGVANMLDKIHAERSSGVSSVKKTNFG